MSTKKIVYVTGCAGFIGSHVANLCLKNGWYVIGVDKMTYAADQTIIDSFHEVYGERFKMIYSDINDLKFLYDCDYLINCAAETHVGNSIVDSDDFIHSNINGVHNLLELLRGYRQENGRTPVLVHFSTDEVYGDITGGAHTETDMLKPSNPYSATKAAADMLIKAWNRTYGIPYIIVRPTNNYGIGQYVEKLIPKAVKYLHLGRKIPLHNNGTPVRTWLNAMDTATAITTIIEHGAINEIYNISSGFEQSNEQTVRDILEAWGAVTGETLIYDNHVDLGVVRDGQDVRYSLDDSKLRKLGWEPTANFKESLLPIVNYYYKKFIW